VTRWSVLAGASITFGATALGGGCALVVGFPDRTMGSTEGAGGATASSSGGPGSASSGGEGGHGGAATTVTSSAASSSSSGGPATYCQALSPQPVFCDDFETRPLVPTWIQQDFANGSAELSIEQATPFPGHSFRAWYMAGGLASDNLGHISKAFPPGYASMHVAFDVFINQYAAAPELTYIAEIDLDNGYGALLYAVPGAATIQQRSPMPPVLGNEINSNKDLGLQTWTHVDITLSLVTSSPPILTLTIDGTKAIGKGDLKGAWAPGVPTIRLGDVVVTTTDVRDVYYDNVVFDAP